MLERTARRSWEDLMDQVFSENLGLDVRHGWPASQDADQPWGHRLRHGKLAPHPPNDTYQLPHFAAPAGDVHLSVTDLATFAQVHLRGLQGKASLLLAETVREMHHDEQGFGYALGWMIQGPCSVHDGCAGTFHCLVVLYPPADLGIAVICNAGHAPGARDGCRLVVQKLMDQFKGGSHKENRPIQVGRNG